MRNRRKNLAEVANHTPRGIPATVKTTLGQLAGANDALARLVQLQLPMKSAYHVAKLARLAGAEISIFFEKRQALYRQFSDEREPTQQEKAMGHSDKVLQVRTDDKAEFEKQIKELAAVEVTLPWGPIQTSTLGDVKMTPADIIALDDLLFVNP